MRFAKGVALVLLASLVGAVVAWGLAFVGAGSIASPIVGSLATLATGGGLAVAMFK